MKRSAPRLQGVRVAELLCAEKSEMRLSGRSGCQAVVGGRIRVVELRIADDTHGVRCLGLSEGDFLVVEGVVGRCTL